MSVINAAINLYEEKGQKDIGGLVHLIPNANKPIEIVRVSLISIYNRRNVMPNTSFQDQMLIIKEKLTDLMVEGYEVEVSPEEADLMGAFAETALSEKDAKESQYD